MRIYRKFIFVAIATAAAFLFTISTEYQRSISPDKAHYAVASKPAWTSYIPAMPGQGGDSAGVITLYTAAGQACGEIPVDMVSSIHGLIWKKNRAELPFIAIWDLHGCKMYGF